MSSAREERLRSHEREAGSSRGFDNRSERPSSYRDRPAQRSRYDDNPKEYRQRDRYRDSYSQFSGNTYQEKKEASLPPKEKPNFKPSGLLAKESNNIKGKQLKYTEPEDATNPPESPIYYLFVFKKASNIPKEYKLNNKSHHLIGRDREVVDLETDHDSCSNQHAVVQFRSRPTTSSTGEVIRQTKPYIIDLESSNGTLLNNKEIPTSRFIELQAEDTIRFGDSETDYVLVIG